MFEDPGFLSRVKERFNDYYNNKELLLEHIDAQALKLIDKIIEDNKLWGKVTTSSATQDEVKTAYQEKVNYLKTWLTTRLEWLKTNINIL